MDEHEDVGPIPAVVDWIDRLVGIELFNGVVFLLVVIFVLLAMGQVIIFDLHRFSNNEQDPEKNNLTQSRKDPIPIGFKIVGQLGMGSAFYALFISHVHLTPGSWVGLVSSVILVAAVGSLLVKIKKGKPTPPECKPDCIVTDAPDSRLSWCLTCRAHTRVLKAGPKQGSCSNCRGTIHSVFIPADVKSSGLGCGAFALAPAIFAVFSLLGGFGKNFALPGTALGGLGFLLIVGFPIYFFYQYGSWKKWSRNSVPNPGDRKDLVGPETPD